MENPGGFDDWIATKTRMQAMAKSSPAKAETKAGAVAAAPRNTRAVKMSYNETRDLERLPKEIEALEAEQRGLQEKLLDPNVYRNAPTDAAVWQARIEAIDQQVLEKMGQWEALEQKRLGE
ncbi:ABC transporter C-terminal domain-containing protein [Chitinimonas arctica]